jgi:hypothetical protein
MKQINNLEELKEICSENVVDIFIYLCAGARSSKNISYNKDKDTWYILNEIDDTEQEVKTENLDEETNIIKALDRKALFMY